MVGGHTNSDSPSSVEVALGHTGLFYGYFVIAASFIIMTVSWGSFYSFGVFFKPMLNEFGWTRAMTSGAFSLSTVISGVLAVAVGGVSDRFGPRLVVTLCGLLMALGYFLMSWIGSLWHLYLFYGIILGAGMSGPFVPIMSTVARWFVSRRSTMTGIVAAGVGIGGFIGPPMARWLISTYGWRVSYIIMSGIVLVFVVLSAQIMRRDPSQVGQIADGESGEEESGDPHCKGGLSLKEAAQTRQFWLVNANFFCFGFCVFSIMVHIAPHATELGISAASAASILATVCAFGIVGKILFGRVGDVFGSRMILIFGFILISAALCFLAGAKAAWGLYTFACIFGVAFGGCAVSHPPLVASLFGLGSLGVVLGVVNLSFSIGGAVGPFLTGYVFDVSGSYQMAFLICALFSGIGFIVMAVLRPVKVKPE